MSRTTDRQVDALLEGNTLEVLDLQYVKALQSADRQQALAREILLEHQNERGSIDSDEHYKAYRAHLDSALYFERQAKGIKRMFMRHAKTAKGLRVNEARTYSPFSNASYFKDVALVTAQRSGLTIPGTTADIEATEAHDRQVRYSQELSAEIRSHSKEGRYALQAVRNNHRTTDQGPREAREVTQEYEQRAADSTSIAGFTTPLWLQDQASLYRSPTASFAFECQNIPLPPYGVTVQWGSFTGPAAVASQGGENEGIDETDPTGIENRPTDIETFAGQVTLSQILFDRGRSPDLPSFDVILVKQMMQASNSAVDAYVIAQAIANAQSVTESTTLTTALWWANVAAARELLADHAGVRFPGTHVFTTTDLAGCLLKQVDDQHRPIFEVDSGALLAAAPAGDPTNANGWLGVHFVTLAAYTDDKIDAPAGDPTWTQAIAVQADEVLVLKSAPITFCYPETEAVDLSVIIGLRTYAVSKPRYDGAVVTITGSGYASLS